MVRYTIGMINFNMAKTLERSLRSVLDQLSEEFEVLVVDGGSTDGSLEILNRLSNEYSNLRYLISPYGCNSSRGSDRALSIAEANGRYVLTHIDTDDRYYDVIRDVVKLYHEIEKEFEKELVLFCNHMAIAPKDHVLKLGSYRPLNAGEDVDFFRRAIASEENIYLEIDTHQLWESLGYSRGWFANKLYTLEIHTCDFQAGTTLRNSIRWALHRDRIVHLPLLTVAYCRATRRKQFEPVDGFREKGLEIFEEHRHTVDEIEEIYDISVDRSILSNTGREHLIK